MDAARLQFDAELIRRLDRPGPRYTSYPTVDRFVTTFGAAAYRSCAARRNAGGVERDLALHAHAPFCRDVRFYFDYLAREIELQAALFSDDRRVGEMHWGGGIPTCRDTAIPQALWNALAARFQLAVDGEYSIEVDPGSADADAIAALRAIGFNRVSFGVRDFDSDVQRAVNPCESGERMADAIAAARRAGISSINVDIVYGLPKQTFASFDGTLARVIDVCPGRIALCNYAHPRGSFKHQRGAAAANVPAPETGLELLALAIEQLGAAGYEYIGMDQFALPDDALAVAQRHGRLRRGLQGYTACVDRDVVGLGVSATGSVGASYSQNFPALDDYYVSLDRGELPVMRGVELKPDDLLRRAVIQELMCHFTVSKEAISVAYLVDFDGYFDSELEELREFEKLGLVTLEPGWVSVTPKGRFLARRICMAFDRYLAGAAGKISDQ